MIPYIPDFLTKHGIDADALFELCKSFPHKRPPNRLSGTGARQKILSYRRKVSYPYFCVSPVKGKQDRFQSIDSAPELIQRLRAAIAEYAQTPIDYIGIGGYETKNDGMNCHQHEDDTTDDQTVYIISLGETRDIAIHSAGVRCFNCSPTRKLSKKEPDLLRPVHGSLYVLPHSYNSSHVHGVCRSKAPCSLRIVIDCKKEYPNTVKDNK